MAKKMSKNARLAQRAANVGSGRDHVKVIKSIKNPTTGKYSFKEMIVPKDQAQEFFANK